MENRTLSDETLALYRNTRLKYHRWCYDDNENRHAFAWRIKNLILMSGTSSVGKSEIFNALNYSSETLNPECTALTKVPMAARNVRKLMGEPSWDELMGNPGLMVSHQMFIFYTYMARIVESIGEVPSSHESTTLLFERHPLDVIAYTKAFYRCPTPIKDTNTPEVNQIVDRACNIMLQEWFRFAESLPRFKLITTFHGIHRRGAYPPYDTEDGARPPEMIRNYVDNELGKMYTKVHDGTEQYAITRSKLACSSSILHFEPAKLQHYQMLIES